MENRKASGAGLWQRHMFSKTTEQTGETAGSEAAGGRKPDIKNVVSKENPRNFSHSSDEGITPVWVQGFKRELRVLRKLGFWLLTRVVIKNWLFASLTAF